MQKLILYPLLNKRSKTAIKRKRKRFGHPYLYSPRQILLSRLSQETGMTKEEVFDQLMREREFLLAHPGYS